ncbi:MAG: hypothetical protein NWF13_06920 [Candidatus Bathyarchaeota archaeon]|nr:hypothetical protein [Candidatus Bathyarchaeota archaeon]
MEMKREVKSEGKKLLLMGSSAFKAKQLPSEVRERIDKAIACKMTIVVASLDYLKSKGYRKVVVGHAIRLRYNAGNWKDKQYGKNLKERERRMIEECDKAIVIWLNNSSVIANNLEILKRLGKPTFLYEYSTETGTAKARQLDSKRNYNPYYDLIEYYKRQKQNKK